MSTWAKFGFSSPLLLWEIMLIYNTYVRLLILSCRGIHKSPCIFKRELQFHSIFLLAYCTTCFIFCSSTIKSWSTHAFLENKNKKFPPWWIMTNNAKQRWSKALGYQRMHFRCSLKIYNSASGDLINIDFACEEQKIKKQPPYSFSAKWKELM